jgi:hypothetical protein
LLSRALSAFDTRQNFVASDRYLLPVGSLLRRQNRWTRGWALSGLTRFTTGLPAGLCNNNDASLLGTTPNGINNNGVDTPNLAVGNLEINYQSVQRQFSVQYCAFQPPGNRAGGQCTETFLQRSGKQ